MSLNNISLPSSLVADLYQHTLVQRTATAMPVKSNLPFLGKNGKNIMVLVNNEEAAYLPDNELAFLTSILGACKLDLSHVAIVNWHHLKEKDPSTVLDQLSPTEVLLLNISPEDFGFPTTPMYALGSAAELKFVAAPSLTDIEKSKEAKKQLWMALKQLFSL